MRPPPDTGGGVRLDVLTSLKIESKSVTLSYLKG